MAGPNAYPGGNAGNRGTNGYTRTGLDRNLTFDMRMGVVVFQGEVLVAEGE